ncbi:MAG TPA: 1,4-dihydroxy-2-naphthoate polyprenyltransferase [Candidatus Hydrogenedentes bacterium]|nr:1,4-dihydroxy-2-naphthoate polyprenyltransferase [Candidatus Hydrogenedentota bacterium]
MRVWILAARPRTLFAAAGPVLMGLVMSATDRALHVPAALTAMACALLLQIGANFVNDYSDGVRGTDTADRLGPRRMVQSGWISARAMRRAAILVLSLAFVIGLYLVVRGGWSLLVLGILAIAAAVLYTAGPYPLGYHGLAEPFVFVFFGPVAVAGTVCAQHGAWEPAALVAGCGPGLLSVALLTVNNIRDLTQDRAAGKRTLAVRIGETRARHFFMFCVLAALVVPPGWAAYVYGFPVKCALAMAGLMALVAGPFALVLVRGVYRDNGRALNRRLGQTGLLIFGYSLIFSAGWLFCSGMVASL